MKKIITVVFLLISINTFSQTKYETDFLEFWNLINNYHAYLEEQNIDWVAVKELYHEKSKSIENKHELVMFLEQLIHELHNGHASLNINYKTSYKIIPSYTDIVVKAKEGKFFITDIKRNSGAELSGLKPSLEVIKVNDINIDKALKNWLPKFTTKYTQAMETYALKIVFAGTHDVKRKITAKENGILKTYYPDTFNIEKTTNTLLDYKVIHNNTGYIKINNSLGNNNLIEAFDTCLDTLINTDQLVIDLTDTPGGGNTTVARAILGRFISKEKPYQKHEFTEKPYNIKRSWIEYVSPRKTQYNKPLIILVSHWTGSMGEGMAIGFDALKRGRIVGTKMAGLIGAIESFTLPKSKIQFQFPTQRLYHIDGTPREDYIPQYLTENYMGTFEKMNELITINQ